MVTPFRGHRSRRVGNHLAGGIHNDRLVSLIGRHLQIIVAVDSDPVTAVDAVGEHRRVGRLPAGNLDVDDQIQRCIGHEHSGPGFIEFDSIRTERRNTVA